MADQPKVKRYVFAMNGGSHLTIEREIGTETVRLIVEERPDTPNRVAVVGDFSGRRLAELQRVLQAVQSDEEDDYER